MLFDFERATTSEWMFTSLESHIRSYSSLSFHVLHTYMHTYIHTYIHINTSVFFDFCFYLIINMINIVIIYICCMTYTILSLLISVHAYICIYMKTLISCSFFVRTTCIIHGIILKIYEWNRNADSIDFSSIDTTFAFNISPSWWICLRENKDKRTNESQIVIYSLFWITTHIHRMCIYVRRETIVYSQLFDSRWLCIVRGGSSWEWSTSKSIDIIWRNCMKKRLRHELVVILCVKISLLFYFHEKYVTWQ